MSGKFHVNTKTGKSGKCYADLRPCPLGGESGTENHYTSKESAAIAAAEGLAREFADTQPLKKILNGWMHPDFGKLDSQVEMDSSFAVDATGTVVPSDDWAPEVEVDEASGEVYMEKGWTPVSGFSNQIGYEGPLMHSSEVISSSGLESHIRENPGTYALVNPLDYLADDGRSDNWMLLRKD